MGGGGCRVAGAVVSSLMEIVRVGEGFKIGDNNCGEGRGGGVGRVVVLVVGVIF